MRVVDHDGLLVMAARSDLQSTVQLSAVRMELNTILFLMKFDAE
jgi:hypothetical protein